MKNLSLAFTVSTVLSISSLASAESSSPYAPGAPRPNASAPERDRAPNPEESDHVSAGTRLRGTADIAGRIGPVGAALQAGLVLHHTLEVTPSGADENSYLEAGVALAATPASVEPQAHVEYMPARFLVLRGDFSAMRYLGTNYGLLRFDSADADFGSDVLSDRRGDEHQGWGMKGGFSVMPRAKLGPVLLRSTLSFTAYRFDDPGPYVYEAELDTLLAKNDFVLTGRTDVLFELHDGPGAETLLLGPMLESRRSLDSDLSRTRLGASFWYVPAEHWASMQRPRLYAMAGANVSDPNRSGEPFAAMGVGADFE